MAVVSAGEMCEMAKVSYTYIYKKEEEMLSEHELNQIRELYVQMEYYVNMYGGHHFDISLQIIQDQIACIDSDVSLKKKDAFLVHGYEQLFQSKTGLNEFFILGSDFDRQNQLNVDFQNISTQLWQIMRNHAR